MELLIIFACGAFVGWKANDIMMRHTFGKMLDEAGMTDKDLKKFADHWAGRMEMDEEEESTPLDHVAIKIEKHGEHLYAFRKDNDQFLGQGATKEDLIARMGEKLRNVNLVVSEEDGSQYIGAGTNFKFNTDTKKITETPKNG